MNHAIELIVHLPSFLYGILFILAMSHLADKFKRKKAG